ncbi:MAG: DUF2007 domain-containing protein [Hyphomonadaceae bacterium]|nr:DUF2007 domain-containing protein [Clostridia bacterium]
MAFCPNCRYEYKKDLKECPECAVQLVAQLPNEPENLQNEVFLTTAQDETQLQMLSNFLQNEGIPIIMKQKNNGDFNRLYMGTSPFGADIYVPENAYERASEIMGFINAPSDLEPTVDFEQEEIAYEQKRSRWVSILLWVLSIPSIIMLIVSMISKFHR